MCVHASCHLCVCVLCVCGACCEGCLCVCSRSFTPASDGVCVCELVWCVSYLAGSQSSSAGVGGGPPCPSAHLPPLTHPFTLTLTPSPHRVEEGAISQPQSRYVVMHNSFFSSLSCSQRDTNTNTHTSGNGQSCVLLPPLHTSTLVHIRLCAQLVLNPRGMHVVCVTGVVETLQNLLPAAHKYATRCLARTAHKDSDGNNSNILYSYL